MSQRYYFTMEPDWRAAPLAFWVHVPVPGAPDAFAPPAPAHIHHHGYAFLHVEVDGVDLQFSAMSQLDHFIDIMKSVPLPTTRRLSAQRGAAAGPNGHWLSRLPARLKSPKRRASLVLALQRIQQQLVASHPSWTVNACAPAALMHRLQTGA